MMRHLESVVRIRGVDGKIVGAGFLIPENQVLTCAHVVDEALKSRQNSLDSTPDIVNLDFLINPSNPITAEIIFRQPKQVVTFNLPENGEDIAVLKLQSSPPKTARPIKLPLKKGEPRQICGILGFPNLEEGSSGVWFEGKLQGMQGNRCVQIDSVKEGIGYTVEGGFSGAPVWDQQQEGVLGMVVAANPGQPRSVFMIPTDVLLKICPILRELNAQRSTFRSVQNYLQDLEKKIKVDLEKKIKKVLHLRTIDKPDSVQPVIELDIPHHSTSYLDNDNASEIQEFDDFSVAFEHHNKRVLLLGEPGAGKTVTLQNFTQQKISKRLKDSDELFPIFLRIATWDRQESLINWLERKTGIDASQLEELIQNQQALLLLDGLDELPSGMVPSFSPDFRAGRTESRDRRTSRDGINSGNYRVKFMQALAEEFGNTPIVVTCRTKDYADISEGKDGKKIALNGALWLQELTNEQVKDYLSQQPQLWSVIQSDTRLLEVVRSPLALDLLAKGYQDVEQTIQQLSDLNPRETLDKIIEAYINKSYETEKLLAGNRSQSNLSIPLAKLKEILGQVALEMLRIWEYSITPESKSIIEIERPVLQQILEDRQTPFVPCIRCTESLRILRPTERGGAYRFTHQVFRDYFALPYCRERLLKEDNVEVRCQVLTALGLIGDIRAAEDVRAVLQDKEPTVREAAIKALALIKDTGAVKQLCKVLQEDEDWLVRATAIWALGEIGDLGAINTLFDAPNGEIETKEFLTAGILVIEALGKIGQPATSQLIDLVQFFAIQLSELLTSTAKQSTILWWSEPFLEQAKNALKKIGDPAIQPLADLLADENWLVRVAGAANAEILADYELADENWLVRVNAVQILGHIGSDSAKPHLIKALQDPDVEVQIVAAQALGQIKAAEAIEPLGTILNNHEYAEVRVLIAGVLGQIGDSRAFKFLETALSHPDGKVRASAVLAWGEIPDFATSDLLAALDDADIRVRDATAKVLEKCKYDSSIWFHRQPSVDELCAVLQSENAEMREYAVGALGQIGSVPVIEPLVQALGDEDVGVRENAAKALVQISKLPALHTDIEGRMALLIKTLQQDEDADVRSYLAEALGYIGNHEAVDPLMKALQQDSDPYVREYAAEALGRICDRRAVELLSKTLLQDKDAYVRFYAAWALGKIGSVKAIKSLIKALTDDVVYLQAQESLINIGEPAITGLIAALRSHDDLKQYCAAEALLEFGKSAINPLILVLQNKRERNTVRTYAATLLGEICSAPSVLDPESQDQEFLNAPIQALIQVLGDENEQVSLNSGQALIKIGKPAVPQLIAARRDRNEQVRNYTSQALGIIGDPDATELLIKRLSDRNEQVQNSAYWALVDIGEDAVPKLIETLHNRNESWKVQRYIAGILGQIGDNRAVEPLIEVLKDDNVEVEVQSYAAEALGFIQDERAIDPLIQALKNENELVWKYAQTALGQMGESAIQPLLNALYEEDEGVQWSAMSSLTFIGKPAVEPLIEEFEKSNNEEVKFWVIKALREIGDKRAIATFWLAVASDYIRVWNEAAEALEKLGQPSDRKPSTEELIDELDRNQNSKIRIYVMQVLGMRRANEAVSVLTEILRSQDETEQIRAEAAAALGNIGDNSAAEVLINALLTANQLVQENAAWALGQIGDNRAVEPLIKVLKDEHHVQVQSYAAAALGNIGDNSATEVLINALLTGSPSVQENAAWALGQMGEHRKAIAACQEAQSHNINLKIPAVCWNSFCWCGSLWGDANIVMDTCEKAVELAAENELYNFRDSRGVARAQTGDFAGAIEDFQIFVQSVEDDDKKQRQGWIEILSKGKNPFTPQEIQRLCDQGNIHFRSNEY